MPPVTSITAAPVFVPAAAKVTPSGGQAQAVTATNAAGGVLLEAICSGGAFPYVSRSDSGKVYPDSVQLCLAPGETATVQVRLDGGTPATTGPWPNLQVKPTYFEVKFGSGPLPTGMIKLIASAATASVQAIFHWSEGRA
jgi:hypothetical protein